MYSLLVESSSFNFFITVKNQGEYQRTVFGCYIHHAIQRDGKMLGHRYIAGYVFMPLSFKKRFQ